MNLSNHEKRELRRLFVETHEGRRVICRRVAVSADPRVRWCKIAELATLQALSRQGALAYDDPYDSERLFSATSPTWRGYLTDAGQAELERALDPEGT